MNKPQFIPFVHSTLCLAKPPSSFPIRSSASVSRLFLLVCQSYFALMFFPSHFRPSQRFRMIPLSCIYMEFRRQQIFVFRLVVLLSSHFQLFYFFSGLNAGRNESLEANPLSCSDKQRIWGTINYYSPDALALPTHSLFVYLLPSVLELSFIQKHFPQIHPLYFLTLFSVCFLSHI